MASRPLTKLTSSTTAGGSSERARRRPSASRRARLIAARAPAGASRDGRGVPDLVERLRRARAPGRAPAAALRSARAPLPAANVSGQRALHSAARPSGSSICATRLPVRDSASRDRRPRARPRLDDSATTGGVPSRTNATGCSERLPGHVARPEHAPCAGPRRERAACRGAGAGCPATSAAATPSIETPEASMVPRVVDVDVEARRCRPTGCPADGAVEIHVGGSRSSRMRPAPVTSSGPGGAMSSALADQLASRSCRDRSAGPAARSRCISRAAAPAACGADAEVPTIAMPGQTAVEAGATTSGLRRPSSRRALRRVGGRGVALPVARAHRERSARVSGRRDARRDGGLVARARRRRRRSRGRRRRSAVLCWTRSP